MSAGEADTDDPSATAGVDGASGDEGDADEGDHEESYLLLVLSELFVIAVGFVVVLASLLGRTTYLAGYSPRLRLAALAFLTVELLIPLGVYVDLRRRPDDPDRAWVHAVSMPVVNVFGLFAYLEERRRRLE